MVDGYGSHLAGVRELRGDLASGRAQYRRRATVHRRVRPPGCGIAASCPPAASPVVDVDPPVAERVGPHPQMVNAKYKVSYEKVVKRLGVTWRNAVRLVVLHEELFGLARLTFASFDAQP